MEPESLFCVHKSPPVDLVLSQMNPVHILKSSFFKVKVKLSLCLTKHHAMKTIGVEV